MFPEISNKIEFPKLEEKILEFWEKEDIFQKSIDQHSKENTYFFYDGPPFATGLPHYGHILAGTIKDVVPRFQTMLGKRVERRFGWDCHGLPVEFEVEKELGLKGKSDIEKMGMSAFNEKCRSIVLRYSNEWKKTVKRMGRWVDFENDYKTMDPEFMESIWWIFKNLWEKKLIYQSGKIVAYSTRLTTPLSNFEVNLNYKEVRDPAITVKFYLKNEPNTALLAWTTTPWTLPSNLSVTVSPEITYTLVQVEDKQYYVAKDLIAKVFKDQAFKVIKECKGYQLEGIQYKPLFDYFKEYQEQGAFQVTLGDYVETSTGTGIVHTAPMFGEDDFKTGKKYNLPELLPMNDHGEFLDAVSDFSGLFFKDADKPIIRFLKEKNLLFHQDTILHNYPFCWRSNTPLMYRSIRTWFVNVEQIKENLLQNNQTIHWSPEHIKKGRMGKWLEGARDWAISRNRYWGTPIPVWICDDCNYSHAIGSKAELEEKTSQKITDLHRHFIDSLTIACPKCDHTMYRTSEVLDCWFESGSMPYAQEHYPFENKEKLDQSFPADFISEGLDQTRGWFYTLSVLSSALFQKPAFKNCIVSGMLLAEDGKKMSKSLKNYPDPSEMIEKYGADAIRLYMMNSGAIKAEELRFSEKGLQETMRNNMIPLWNALSFFTTYANVDQWKPTPVKNPINLINPLDQWILSQLHHLVQKVRESMEKYLLNEAVQPFVHFIDQLTNWYIRRSRRRFWKSEQGTDKTQAYMTLYTVLLEFSKVIAPFIPYLAENMFQTLNQNENVSSVHLSSYPKSDSKWINSILDEKMEIVIQAVAMGRAIRAKQQIKIRQPLESITLLTKNLSTQNALGEMEHLIKDELNIKNVFIAGHEEELVHLSAKPNLKILGPKYKKELQQLRPLIASLTQEQILTMQQGNSIEVILGENKIPLNIQDILIQREQKQGLCVESNGTVTVALNIKLNDDLIAEGYAREFINKVQLTRKENQYEVTDRIKVYYHSTKQIQQAISKYSRYIQQEILANELIFTNQINDNFVDWELNDQNCSIQVLK